VLEDTAGSLSDSQLAASREAVPFSKEGFFRIKDNPTWKVRRGGGTGGPPRGSPHYIAGPRPPWRGWKIAGTAGHTKGEPAIALHLPPLALPFRCPSSPTADRSVLS